MRKRLKKKLDHIRQCKGCDRAKPKTHWGLLRHHQWALLCPYCIDDRMGDDSHLAPVPH